MPCLFGDSFDSKVPELCHPSSNFKDIKGSLQLICYSDCYWEALQRQH